MQTQRYIYPVDLTELNEKIEKICEKMGLNKAEVIREAIDFYHNYVMGLKVIELREISREQAEREILQYLKEKGKAWTSDIADDLRLDIDLVNKIMNDLVKKGMVE
ncbi:MAG: ribbon-helix-helix protein, CopG family [Candidatus Aenigmarchaeota archaeon]|nr:ribbon-helix-helix protein, CopG family [Candidatus Aenigmarchaeota archaeon]